MSVLKVENLSLGYNGEIIVENLKFNIEQGDYLCIIGENGAGKSTLVRTILGLQDAACGTVTLGDGLKKSEIGYLPQQTNVQKDFPASVREIVLSGCQARNGMRPFYKKEFKLAAENNMRRMGVDTLAGRCYRDLSGGQQQRVLLARALCATSKLLLLDEPVSGLDPKATADMYETIKNLNDEGITIVMISHDTEAAYKYASHILHVKRNPVFETKDEYVNSDLGKAFLSI